MTDATSLKMSSIHKMIMASKPCTSQAAPYVNTHISREHDINGESCYNEDYYERGLYLGISHYVNYRWLPDRTLSDARKIANVATLEHSDKILDFGCAKGFLVKAFSELGFKHVYGCDISEYAIGTCDASVRDQCKVSYTGNVIPFNIPVFDLVIASHVFEHIYPEDLIDLIRHIRLRARKLFVRVPLGWCGQYINPKHKQDRSHVIAEDREWWILLFHYCGFHIQHSHATEFSKAGQLDEAEFLLA